MYKNRWYYNYIIFQEVIFIEPVEHEFDDSYTCVNCGETHDNGTISGWWTELIHHILFIIQRIFLWWA